jgi:hypothetical protein
LTPSLRDIKNLFLLVKPKETSRVEQQNNKNSRSTTSNDVYRFSTRERLKSCEPTFSLAERRKKKLRQLVV